MLPFLLCLGEVDAQAPSAEIQKQLIQRQQYQDELYLRRQQTQESSNPSLTPQQRQELQRRQFDQRQQQRQLHDGQLRRHLELQQRLPDEPSPQAASELAREAQEFARERAEQLQRFRQHD